MVGDPDVVRAHLVADAGFICWYPWGESQIHIIRLEEVQKRLDHVGGGVKMMISFRLPERMVAVEVSKPEHGVCGGGEYEGEVSREKDCER